MMYTKLLLHSVKPTLTQYEQTGEISPKTKSSSFWSASIYMKAQTSSKASQFPCSYLIR